MVVASNPVVVTQTSDIAPVLSKEFPGIQATLECKFTLKRVRDMLTDASRCSGVFIVNFEHSSHLLLVFLLLNLNM